MLPKRDSGRSGCAIIKPSTLFLRAVLAQISQFRWERPAIPGLKMNLAPSNDLTKMARNIALLVVAAISISGCHSKSGPAPGVEITHVPVADAGGPDKLDYIEGKVRGAKPGQHIVLFAHSGIWWVQPFGNRPLTEILPDQTWKNSTHLGTDYAAILVDAGYHPPSRTSVLPEIGDGVIAVAVAKGAGGAPVVQKVVHFSGYDWVVRSAGSDRGGEPNAYDPENVWTDERGYLHLRMADRNGKWTCAEVSLNHSLGYGTYRFVVQDSAHLDASAVVGIYTWDDVRSQDFRNELDIELSRWGNPTYGNAQYVVQPFYVPENVSRFQAPAGVLTHEFRWEPDRVEFRTTQGAGVATHEKPISQHVFTSGIPTAASETVHIDLYEFHHSKNPSHQPSEVVIEKFEYLP